MRLYRGVVEKQEVVFTSFSAGFQLDTVTLDNSTETVESYWRDLTPKLIGTTFALQKPVKEM